MECFSGCFRKRKPEGGRSARLCWPRFPLGALGLLAASLYSGYAFGNVMGAARKSGNGIAGYANGFHPIVAVAWIVAASGVLAGLVWLRTRWPSARIWTRCCGSTARRRTAASQPLTSILSAEIVGSGLIPALILTPGLRARRGWLVSAGVLACSGVVLNRFVPDRANSGLAHAALRQVPVLLPELAGNRRGRGVRRCVRLPPL